MQKFTESFLDDLRARVSVSEIVRRHIPDLRKAGAEWECLSPFNAENTPSFKVNDQKRIWHDFSSGEGGDVFAFEQKIRGCSFPDAVGAIAEVAGVAVPGRTKGDKSAGRSAEARSDRSAAAAATDSVASAESAGRKKKREIIATYDYVNADGSLRYQVVRFDPKSFGQRRPNPREAGTWIWGLDVKDKDGCAYEFMRKQAGRDWQRLDEEKFKNWHYQEKITFDDLDNIEHGLFNYAEVAEEFALPEDRRTIHLCEGEKDVLTLKSWGFLATTNSGGARHFDEKLAKLFADCDVIAHKDNDVAGNERIAKIAPLLLAVGARVRVCDPRLFWNACPEKADITDWRDKAGGTAEQLYEIIDDPLRAPDWKPEPYRSKLGAVRWREQTGIDRPKYEWTIRGVVPRKRTVLIYGDSQVGKSFEAFDMAMSIARGIDFGGRRTRQGGVIYVAAEKGAGFINRMIAYRKFHKISENDDLPLAVLTRRINIWLDDKMIDVIAQECIEIAKEWSVPLEAIVFDTHNAATSGASEIKSEEVTMLKDRYETLIEKTGASVWIVHHKNAQGNLRGSLILYNAIETAIELLLVADKHSGPQKDDAGRLIRRAVVRKQSEGQAGETWDFVLRVVDVGFDEFGDKETSCVTDAPERPETQDEKRDDKRAMRSTSGFHLNKGEVAFFRSLLKALNKGIAPSLDLALPSSITRVVLWNDFTRAYREENPNSEGTDKAATDRYMSRIKKAIERARGTLTNYKLIGVAQLKTAEGEHGQHVIWPTGRPVWGQGLTWPEPKPEKPKSAPVIDNATGQEITSIDDDPVF